MPLRTERRKFKRVKANFIVIIIYKIKKSLKTYISTGKEEIYALMVDLSEGGMAVVTKHDIGVSTDLLIKFILFDYTTKRKEERVRTMEIEGKVRYNIPTKRGKHRIGITFKRLNKEDRSVITKFVESTRG